MYISNQTFRSRGGTLFFKGQKISNMRYFLLNREDKSKFTKEKDISKPPSTPTSKSYSSDYSDGSSYAYAFPAYDSPAPSGDSGWGSSSSSDSGFSGYGGGDSGGAGSSGSWDSGGYDSGSCDSGGGDCGGGDCGGGGD
jgi:uncharacterized membrane protein YgcG